MPIASRAALPLLLCLAAGTAGAQAIPLPGGTYLQNFDTLSNVAGSTTNSALPAGWMLTESGGGARDNEQYAVDNGGSNTGDTYSYGSAGSTDRALGSLRSGTLVPVFGACFTNTTGGTVNSIDVAYIGEQWRLGTAGRTDTLQFQYSTDATSLTTGTWNAHAALDFTTPATATVGAKDGNVADNRTARASTVSGLSVANGAGFCIRWSDLDASGADDGLAIDDFSITVGAASPAPDFSAELIATPQLVSVGETFEIRQRLSNSGQMPLTVATTLQIPPGLTRVHATFEAWSPGYAASCAPTSTVMTCTSTIAPGDWGVALLRFSVDEGATGPFEFTLTTSDGPPAGDSNPANDSDSVTVELVREVAIHDIQDRGIGSPLLGSRVITEGIVTARRSNGYFIQTAQGEDDGDASTAEGLFVFTSSAPPADAVVGNRVRVRGRVSEYERTPHGFPLTQLASSEIVAVVATDQPLPAPVPIDESALAPDVPVDFLGRYQGMRVAVTASDVVGPSNSFGDFYVVPARTPRPAREPGIAVLDAVPLPPEKAIPLFDRNPERLRVESTGLGRPAQFHDTGTRLPRMEGILYYDHGDFTLLFDSMATARALVPENRLAAAPRPQPGAIRIAGFNVENLNSGSANVQDRLAKLTDVFCQYLHNPDIVGLVEVANLATAQRLAQAINDDEFGNCPDNPQYAAHLLASSGNQRLAYLVRQAPAPGGDAARVEVLSVEELYTADMLQTPTGAANGVLFDRPPLLLRARVTGDNGNHYDVNVLLNHTLSLLEVVSLESHPIWGTQGERSRNKRMQQAVKIAAFVEQFQQADPSAPLVLIGDYNAYDFSDGYVDVIGIISGTAAPEDEVLVWAPSPVTRPLTNLIGTRPAGQRYSYVYEGNLQNLDHVLVNEAVLADTLATLHHARVNADFAVDNAADPTVPMRSSDHDPVIADLVVPAFLDSDLAARFPVLARNGNIGRELLVTVEVRNHGPQRAIEPTLTLFAAAAPSALRQVTTLGWICAAPVAVDGGSAIDCERSDALPSGRSELLVFGVTAPSAPTLELQATVGTRSVDTDAANDAAYGSVRLIQAK